jgi:hypothetical protein
LLPKSVCCLSVNDDSRQIRRSDRHEQEAKKDHSLKTVKHPNNPLETPEFEPM